MIDSRRQVEHLWQASVGSDLRDGSASHSAPRRASHSASLERPTGDSAWRLAALELPAVSEPEQRWTHLMEEPAVAQRILAEPAELQPLRQLSSFG